MNEHLMEKFALRYTKELNRSIGTAVVYTYDAEGVRRSKVNGDDTIYYISDTTGSLSYTLAETDKDGNVIATYNRADVLISQVRDETTSYYLFDGHGDVRALINEEGRISDKYRYNAYGELVERSGETENHYLYTGEYYDGTSNLYYLRARYMNPSTGTFISMDTYEGSIYDPDTLHKYLYANGNPVKYSDPTGNFSAVTMAAGMAINDCITTAYNVRLMGILSGLSNMAVNSILGKQGVGLVTDFFDGYQSGVWTAGILHLTAMISVKAFAIVAFGTAVMETIASVVLLISAIVEKDTKQILVYTTLTILSIINLYQTCNISGEILVSGNKGSGTITVENGSNSSWYNEDGSINYPPNNGAVSGTENTISLKLGDTLGRYGNIGENSNFVTKPGADSSTLSLPPNTDPSIYQEFVVIKEIPNTVQAEIAAWGDSIGGGIQYELPMPIKQLIEEGYIVPK